MRSIGLFLLLILILIIGCSAGQWTKKTFFNSFSVEIPDYLHQSVLKDFDGIYFENKSREVYLTLDQGDKSDFENSGVVFSFNLVSKLILSELQMEMQESNYEEYNFSTKLNYSAIHWELSGKMKSGFFAHYLLSVFEQGENYYVMIQWTAESNWNKNKSDFERTVRSFTLLNP